MSKLVECIPNFSCSKEKDEAAYNALCLDDARNRWWGYDYRQDLKGELTEDYFLSVARRDFAARRAVNFAVRLDRQLIGEVVLYRFDWRGGAGLPHRPGLCRARLRHRGLRRCGGLGPVPAEPGPGKGQVL